MSTLIIGRDEDLCCQLVRESLLHSGEDVLYLPEDHLFPGLKLAWDYRRPRVARERRSRRTGVAVSEIDGVLARCYGIATSAEDFQTRNGQYLCSEWHALLRGFLQAFSCPVINRLRPELVVQAPPSDDGHARVSSRACRSSAEGHGDDRIDEARRFFRRAAIASATRR